MSHVTRQLKNNNKNKKQEEANRNGSQKRGRKGHPLGPQSHQFYHVFKTSRFPYAQRGILKFSIIHRCPFHIFLFKPGNRCDFDEKNMKN